MMAKRPSTPGSPPPPKRQELPSSSQETHHPALPLEEEKLQEIINYIKTRMASTEDAVQYGAIYWKVHDLYEILKRHQTFVSAEDFSRKLKDQREHFSQRCNGEFLRARVWKTSRQLSLTVRGFAMG